MEGRGEDEETEDSEKSGIGLAILMLIGVDCDPTKVGVSEGRLERLSWKEFQDLGETEEPVAMDILFL